MTVEELTDNEVIDILDSIQKEYEKALQVRANGKTTTITRHILALARAKKIIGVYQLMTEKELDL